ncbi:MAG: hypothetical protein WA354_05085 [Terracidiphilus sp.]
MQKLSRFCMQFHLSGAQSEVQEYLMPTHYITLVISSDVDPKRRSFTRPSMHLFAILHPLPPPPCETVKTIYDRI